MTEIVVFDRDGLPVKQPLSPAVVLEPDSLLGDGGEVSTSQKIVGWLSQHGQAPAVAIHFAKFTDGRGFSLAARLREAGYGGELHAVGAISQDLVFQLRRVGFTHFHLADPGVARIERHILEPFGGYYQAAQDGSRAPWQQWGPA